MLILNKAHFVERNYNGSTFKWIVSWFKKKPKDADNSEIEARETDEKIMKAKTNHEANKAEVENRNHVLASIDEKEYSDAAYDAIRANLNRLKENNVQMAQEINEQNDNFDKQMYMQNKNKKLKY